MTSDDILQELKVIRDRLAGILDDTGKRSISAAIKRVTDWNADEKARLKAAKGKGKGKGKRKRKPPEPWTFAIDPGAPLSFSPTTSKIVKHKLSVDVFCSISEMEKGMPCGDHNIAVRVWTDDLDLGFREEWDASELEDQIKEQKRRVMLRFHFNLANSDQPGPKFHLQIGGVPHAGELCWLPKNWKLPRFVHHPVGLLMVCEFVVKTFYPEHHAVVSEEPSWLAALNTEQKEYLGPYFRGLPILKRLSVPDTAFEGSLLASLWNT